MFDRQSQRLFRVRRYKKALQVIMLSACLTCGMGPEIVASTAETLVKGAVGRSKAIKSGRLEYRFESGAFGPNALPLNRSSPKALSFSGADWIERDRESVVALINCDGVFMDFAEIRQPNGETNRTASISKPRLLEESGHQNRRPWFAGSFWSPRQVEYIEKRCAEFRLTMPSEVDGIHCATCELDVPGSDVLHAFRIHSPLLAAGATLRMYVADQLEFVLPRIEVCSADGVKVVTYASRDFVAFPGRIYFPRHIRMELRAPEGETVFEQFTITPELINQPIPESDFIVMLPAGTSIRDERDEAHVRRFDLIRDSSSSAFAGRLSDRRELSVPEMSFSPQIRNWAIATALVTAVVCLLLTIRHMRLRSQPK